MPLNRKYNGLTILGKSRTVLPQSPESAKLEVFSNAYGRSGYRVIFDCPEFTALCPITGQPDFGRITIEYIPNRVCIESKSLKLYLFSFRNSGIFHEEVVNRILADVVRAARPRSATVTGEFKPRGGIAIKVEASYRNKKIQFDTSSCPI